jgi:hypothetical protein
MRFFMPDYTEFGKDSGSGAPPRQYQLAVDGIADVAWGPHGYTPGVHPLSELSELPFVTRSTEANSVAYWKVFEKHLQARWDA